MTVVDTKNQFNYSDQSQQKQTARWTNQNSSQTAREKSRVQGAIDFGFAFHWLARDFQPEFWIFENKFFFFAYPTLKTPFEMRSSQYHQKDNTVAFWGQQHQRPRILESKRNSYLSSKLLGSILCIKRFISSYLRFSLPISIKLNLKFDLGRCSDRPDPLFGRVPK